MDYCSNCDIAHERGRRGCPLCEADEKIESLEEEIGDLKVEIEELKTN